MEKPKKPIVSVEIKNSDLEKEYIEYKVEDKFYLINSLRESYGVDSNRFNKLVDYIGKMRGELVCGDDIEVKVLESRGVYGYNGMYNVSYPDEIKKYIYKPKWRKKR